MSNDDDSETPELFLELIQTYSDKTATSLSCNAPVAYPVHVVRLNLNEEQKRCLIDHENTVLGFLLAEGWKRNVRRGGPGLEKDVSQYRSTSLELVPLETARAFTFSSNSRK